MFTMIITNVGYCGAGWWSGRRSCIYRTYAG